MRGTLSSVRTLGVATRINDHYRCAWGEMSSSGCAIHPGERPREYLPTRQFSLPPSVVGVSPLMVAMAAASSTATWLAARSTARTSPPGMTAAPQSTDSQPRSRRSSVEHRVRGAGFEAACGSLRRACQQSDDESDADGPSSRLCFSACLSDRRLAILRARVGQTLPGGLAPVPVPNTGCVLKSAVSAAEPVAPRLLLQRSR